MPGVEVGPGSESRADAQGFPGNLGEPPATLQVQPEDKEYRQNKRPGDQEALPFWPNPATGTQSEQRSKGSNGERGAKPSRITGGSLSVLVVPIESRETGPREPANREGGRRVMDSVLGHTTDTQGSDERVDETASDSRDGEAVSE